IGQVLVEFLDRGANGALAGLLLGRFESAGRRKHRLLRRGRRRWLGSLFGGPNLLLAALHVGRRLLAGAVVLAVEGDTPIGLLAKRRCVNSRYCKSCKGNDGVFESVHGISSAMPRAALGVFQSTPARLRWRRGCPRADQLHNSGGAGQGKEHVA